MGHQFRGVEPHNKGKGKVLVLNFCKCGCGELCKKDFVRGHSAKVIHWAKSEKRNEVCNRLSESASQRTGELSPRFGKTKETNPNFSNGGVKKGTIPWNKDKHDYFSDEAIEGIRKGRLGIPAWNSGLKDCHPPEVLEKTVHRGPDNAWYIDGRSCEANPYPERWTRKFKDLIKERDNFTCQICFEHKENLPKGSLMVHHIDYIKSNLELDNLIALCSSCHAKTNYNRSYWIKYFNGPLKLVVNN